MVFHLPHLSPSPTLKHSQSLNHHRPHRRRQPHRAAMLAALRSRLDPHRPLATLSSFLLRRGFASQTPEILKLEEIKKVLADVKTDNVRVVPIGEFCDWADFMVFATGRSDWHVKNIAQAIMYKAGAVMKYFNVKNLSLNFSFHFRALQGQYQNDLKGLIFDTNNPLIGRISGEDILTRIFQIDVNRSKWIDLSVTFSMIIAYRVIFFLMMKINEDVTPWVRGLLARRRLKQQKKVSGNQTASNGPDHLTQSPSLRSYVAVRSTNNRR